MKVSVVVRGMCVVTNDVVVTSLESSSESSSLSSSRDIVVLNSVTFSPNRGSRDEFEHSVTSISLLDTTTAVSAPNPALQRRRAVKENTEMVIQTPDPAAAPPPLKIKTHVCLFCNNLLNNIYCTIYFIQFLTLQHSYLSSSFDVQES